MPNDDLDRILSTEQEVIPSSGFVADVMDAVQREALVPPPIPFPWKWAVPGIAAGVLAVALLLFFSFLTFRGASTEPMPSVLSAASTSIVHAFQSIRVGWIALALALSFASVKLSSSITFHTP